MYAIIKTGGKQYRVSQGDIFNVEKLEGEPGTKLSFDEIFAVGEGASLKVGTPIVAGAKVAGEIITHGRARKVIVVKFKRTRNYKRKRGHRQSFTRIRITSIAG
jgi:large subunit ribosomal protein L21